MPVYAAAMLTALIALIDDLKRYRISNKIIAGGIAAACFIRLYGGGVSVLPDMAFGMLLPVVICMPLLLLSMVGAGDIKLFMVMGLFLGCPMVLWLMVLTCITAAFAVFIKRISGKELADRFRYLAVYMYTLFSGGLMLPYISDNEKSSGPSYLIHVSAPVFISLIILICLKRIV